MRMITVLMNDRAGGVPGVLEEHGLSLLVQWDARQWLFDCGSTGAFLANADTLGFSLDNLDGVILSHGHDDHGGGFPALLRRGCIGPLYTGEGFFVPKYSRKDGRLWKKAPGFGEAELASRKIDHRTVSDAREISPGVWIVSGFPRVTDFEEIPARFLLKTEAGFIPDFFRDEVCMVLEAGEGLILLLGCAHPGIVNMARHVTALLGKPLLGIVGGAHLLEAEDARIRKTAAALKNLGTRWLALGHCTGDRALELLESCIPLEAGTRLDLQQPFLRDGMQNPHFTKEPSSDTIKEKAL